MTNIILIMILNLLASKLTIFNIIEQFGTNRKIDFFNIGSSGYLPRYHWTRRDLAPTHRSVCLTDPEKVRKRIPIGIG